MTVYCGVDGGGTRTRATVVDATGQLLGYGASTASNPKAVGLDAAAQAISEAVAKACEALPRSHALRVFAGIAGVRTEHDRAAVGGVLHPQLAALNFEALTLTMGADIQNALAGALGGAPGIVLVAGTGSAAYGRNAAGATKQAGGWGWFIDDPGSGYWLGYQAMRAAARSHDGRGPKTPLEEAVRSFLRLKTLHEMPNIIYNPHFSRERVAELAPTLLTLAGEGDAVAQAILRDGVHELALMVATVAHALDMPTCQVAPTGGVADSGPLFLDTLRSALQQHCPGLELTPPLVAPAVGATILALQQDGVDLAPSRTRDLDTAVRDAADRLRHSATHRP